MKEFDDSVDLRSIQQYLYCPHRFGLMENNCSWAENVFVNRGNLAHERVTEGKYSASRGTIQERSVRVFQDEWGLFGVLDCLELKKDKNGVEIPIYSGKYTVSIVEYKVTAPKNNQIRIEDRMQLLGQKICVDSLFSCHADTYFYYHDTRRREKIEFSEEDYSFLKQTLTEIREIKQKGIIPPIRNDQYCSGCSMKDICLPPKRSQR
ncbi:MAG: CRISPR-associated protein Cas4 [Clostridia bacterium]|nr:CRISPR-associated protein Cas4 [Clostridia bacterium]